MISFLITRYSHKSSDLVIQSGKLAARPGIFPKPRRLASAPACIMGSVASGRHFVIAAWREGGARAACPCLSRNHEPAGQNMGSSENGRPGGSFWGLVFDLAAIASSHDSPWSPRDSARCPGL